MCRWRSLVNSRGLWDVQALPDLVKGRMIWDGAAGKKVLKAKVLLVHNVVKPVAKLVERVLVLELRDGSIRNGLATLVSDSMVAIVRPVRRDAELGRRHQRYDGTGIHFDLGDRNNFFPADGQATYFIQAQTSSGTHGKWQ